LSERRLELAEDRRLARRETHVACEHELVSGGTRSPLNLCDSNQPARAEAPEEETERRLASQFRRLLSIFRDPRYVDVGDKVVLIGAFENENPDTVVSLGLLEERDKVADQFRTQKVHRGSGNFCKQQGPSLFTFSVSKVVVQAFPDAARAFRDVGLGSAPGYAP
jgi:hypothetical protein